MRYRLLLVNPRNRIVAQLAVSVIGKTLPYMKQVSFHGGAGIFPWRQ
jgi:hypothetical protein